MLLNGVDLFKGDNSKIYKKNKHIWCINTPIQNRIITDFINITLLIVLVVLVIFFNLLDEALSVVNFSDSVSILIVVGENEY